MSGTDIVYAAPRRIRNSSEQVSAYAMPGTDLAYGALLPAYALAACAYNVLYPELALRMTPRDSSVSATRCPRLTSRMLGPAQSLVIEALEREGKTRGYDANGTYLPSRVLSAVRYRHSAWWSRPTRARC
eukprot:3230981-Rhodomonas_salina.1